MNNDIISYGFKKKNDIIAKALKDADQGSARHMLVTARHGKEETVRKYLQEMPGVTGVYNIFSGYGCLDITDNNMIIGFKTGDETNYKQIANRARNIDGVSYVTELKYIPPKV